MTDLIGFHAVRECLRESPAKARCLYIVKSRRDARIEELILLAKDRKVRYQMIESSWMKRRGITGTHQNVLLDCHEIAIESEGQLKEKWTSFPSDIRLLVLDEIEDPHNLGACLRSANGAGVDVVVLTKRKSAPLSEATMRVAQGGNEGLCVVEVVNLARFLEWLKSQGVRIYGASEDAEKSWSNADFQGPVAIVLGNEHKGLRRLTKEKCDELICIDMQGSVSSLNVSVACGVVLFEVLRQRKLTH
tara:strand:- start:539 stop:1279 length:741 start_codon:yes stop_codon:yes gene_type:complete